MMASTMGVNVPRHHARPGADLRLISPAGIWRLAIVTP